MIITFRFHHSDRDCSIIRWNLFHHQIDFLFLPQSYSLHITSWCRTYYNPIKRKNFLHSHLSFLISNFSFNRLSHFIVFLILSSFSFSFDLHQAENRIGWYESKKVLVSSFCHAFVTDFQKIGITFALEKGEIVKG